jgi:hypothetical protein
MDGGGRPGEVIVIGARPSMGKSALGLTIGVNVAERGEPVGYWSGEMPRTQLHTRAMSMRSHIHLSRLKRPERLRDFDWPAITKGVDQLKNLPLYINDQAGLTITKLRSKVRALKRHRGLRVFVVDHLGLMEPTDPRAHALPADRRDHARPEAAGQGARDPGDPAGAAQSRGRKARGPHPDPVGPARLRRHRAGRGRRGVRVPTLQGQAGPGRRVEVLRQAGRGEAARRRSGLRARDVRGREHQLHELARAMSTP